MTDWQRISQMVSSALDVSLALVEFYTNYCLWKLTRLDLYTIKLV